MNSTNSEGNSEEPECVWTVLCQAMTQKSVRKAYKGWTDQDSEDQKYFGSSRDRLPGFRLGSFRSVGSVQVHAFHSVLHKRTCLQIMVPFCLFLCSLVLPSELDCAKFEYSNSRMVSISWEVVVNSEVQLPSAVALCLPAPSLVNSSQIVFFDYVDNSGFLPSSAPWNLSCGLDKSDSDSNSESWLMRSGLSFSVEL